MTVARAALMAALCLVTACGPPASGPAERVLVPPGATFTAVTDSLVSHGVVAHRGWFKLLARLRRVDRSVKAGVYEFPRAAPAWEVLTKLERGEVLAQRFTVPEGLSIRELADLASGELDIPADSVIAAAHDPTVPAELGLPGPTMEGFLLPNTYQLPADVTGRELVRIMGRTFLEQWKPEWTIRLDTLGLSLRQLVTLASIVEGEAAVDSEREVISGVYHNRLKLGMPLQADPTVIYAIELQTGKRKARLFLKDYQFPSIYNTYLHPGLPPGPISSPGLRSIEAALYPDSVPWLYFVARPDGSHAFSRNYDEHLAQVARSRRLRQELKDSLRNSERRGAKNGQD